MKTLFKSSAIALIICLFATTLSAQEKDNYGKMKQPTSLEFKNNNVESSLDQKSEPIKASKVVDNVTKLKQEYLNASQERRLEIDNEIKKINTETISNKELNTYHVLSKEASVSSDIKTLNSQLDQKKAQLRKSNIALEKAKLKFDKQVKAGKLSESDILIKQEKILSVEEKIKALKSSINRAQALINHKS